MRGKQLSSLEKPMGNILIEIGFIEGTDFSYDYPIRCKYRYRIDFPIHKIKLGIECDGEYWHPPENEHDRRRDAFLKRNGWYMLRFTGDEIMNKKEYVKEKIIETSKRLSEVR